MRQGTHSKRSKHKNWLITVVRCLGAGVGMAIALMALRLAETSGFLAGLISVLVGSLVGAFLGQFIGRLLTRPPNA